jgi:CheY-like chemotaxis protein
LIQKTTCRALLREGYQVDIAGNGLECLKMVSLKRYEVILMDIQMPVMDGLEACRRLRLMEKEREQEANMNGRKFQPNSFVEQRNRFGNGEIRREMVGDKEFENMEEGNFAEVRNSSFWQHFIIGVSANGDDDSRQEALKIGMNDFIPKPISMIALKECFDRHKVVV